MSKAQKIYDPTVTDQQNDAQNSEHSKLNRLKGREFVNSKDSDAVSLHSYHEGTLNQLFTISSDAVFVIDDEKHFRLFTS